MVRQRKCVDLIRASNEELFCYFACSLEVSFATGRVRKDTYRPRKLAVGMRGTYCAPSCRRFRLEFTRRKLARS